jgi:hypothetical protein
MVGGEIWAYTVRVGNDIDPERDGLASQSIQGNTSDRDIFTRGIGLVPQIAT